MSTILILVQIILGVTLTGLVIVQSKNSGAGAVFGGDTSFKATRRGLDKTLFNLTVVVAIFFFLVSLITAIVSP